MEMWRLPLKLFCTNCRVLKKINKIDRNGDVEITIKIILHKLPSFKTNQQNRQKWRCGDYYHFEFDVVIVAAAVDPHEDGVAGPGREPQRQRVADVVRSLARRVGEGHQANARPKLVQGAHCKHTGKDRN